MNGNTDISFHNCPVPDMVTSTAPTFPVVKEWKRGKRPFQQIEFSSSSGGLFIAAHIHIFFLFFYLVLCLLFRLEQSFIRVILSFSFFFFFFWEVGERGIFRSRPTRRRVYNATVTISHHAQYPQRVGDGSGTSFMETISSRRCCRE